MDNYIIYRIRDNTTGDTYIGSTRKSLEERKNTHIKEKDCKSWEILKNNNYTIKPLLKRYCSKKTALWMERFAMNNHYKVINYQRSIITREEKLREKREYMKEYNKKNKERMKKRRASKQVIYTCKCGTPLKLTLQRERAIKNHEKSKKHQRWVESKL